MLPIRTYLYIFYLLPVMVSCSGTEPVSNTKANILCQSQPGPKLVKIARSYRNFERQVKSLPVEKLQKQWHETGIVRFKLDTRWLGESIEHAPEDAWMLHKLEVSEDLELNDILPSRMRSAFSDLKAKIQLIIDHQEYGTNKQFIVRRWKNEDILKRQAERIFGDEALAYPWHKDPRYASAIITVRGRVGTEYVDFNDNDHFRLYAPDAYLPLVFQPNPGADLNIKQTGLHEVIILAGRHSAHKGRSIIHRSPPKADPELGAGGRVILLLELI